MFTTDDLGAVSAQDVARQSNRYPLLGAGAFGRPLHFPWIFVIFDNQTATRNRRHAVIYTFENHSLDAERRELRRAAELVRVEPQVFDLLLFLIRNRERVVSKDDLIAGVWNGRTVSESAVSSRITAARHAVGDRGDQQRLIRTIARKGVRFVADVQEEQPGSSRAAKEVTTAPAHAPPLPKSARAKEPFTLGLPEKPSIVVLPFAESQRQLQSGLLR